MKKIIDFSSFLEETSDPNALTYYIKLYLKEKEGIPVKINPTDIVTEIIEVEYGNLEYKFIWDTKFSLEYEFIK